LLLGLKGTMSEAELHVMRMRMIGGVLTKARRGELCPLLPIGFMYDDENKVMLDPDRQVQESIRLVFSLFRRTGSAYALVRHFRDKRRDRLLSAVGRFPAIRGYRWTRKSIGANVDSALPTFGKLRI
jgi:DNA invertase Pin-like site-specific DNA recombinase